jgi:hypothetical protein
MNPTDPPWRKAFVLQQDNWMLDFVKRFLKIQFKNEHLFLGLMAKMQKLKCPCEAILDSSPLNETKLMQMHNFCYHRLKPNREHLCE